MRRVGSAQLSASGQGTSAIAPTLFQIDWIGRLEQLLSGDSPYAMKVRAGFRSDWEDKPEQLKTNSITDEELQAYLEYLSEYGC